LRNIPENFVLVMDFEFPEDIIKIILYLDDIFND